MPPTAPGQNLLESLPAHHQAALTAWPELVPPPLQGLTCLGTCPGIFCQCPAPGGFITR